MLLDDWKTTLLPIAYDLITKHGKTGLDFLWGKFSKKLGGLMGPFPNNDWGGSFID